MTSRHTVGRGDYTFRVIIWARKGDIIFQEIAGTDDMSMARACYELAVKQFPGERITLQRGIMVMESTTRDGPIDG